MHRCAATGETRDGEIEASPKEMYWARLAEKRAAEIGEYVVRDQKNLPKSVYELAIVGCIRQIPTEWNRFREANSIGLKTCISTGSGSVGLVAAWHSLATLHSACL
jgi:hypothetical protein